MDNDTRSIGDATAVAEGPVPRVFVAQMPMKWDGHKQAPLYDTDTAMVYGKLIELMPRGASLVTLRSFALDLEAAMVKHSVAREDYLMAIGSPILISLAAYLFMDRTNGFMNLLTFDRRQNGYTHTVIDVT